MQHAECQCLSVVVPAYNEEQRLLATLLEVVEYLSGRDAPWEVLVVDDGSSDDTMKVVRGFNARGVRGIRLEENQGKGAAVKRGVAESRGCRVLISDADLSTPIGELSRLEEALERGADLVIGSRAHAESHITQSQPRARVWMGRIFNRIVRVLGMTEFTDTQCGFKLIRGASARSLFQQLRMQGFAFDVELLWLALRRGLTVKEVGVAWAHSPSSSVRMVTDSSRMLFDVLRLAVLGRWRDKGGEHSAPSGAGLHCAWHRERSAQV